MMVVTKVMRPLVFFILLLFLAGCKTDPPVPAGRIRIKNDFSGTKESTLQVSGGGKSATLTAGQWILLPPGTTDITFSYTSKAKGTRRWGVRCPTQLNDGIVIKLIDVTQGKVAGGCKKTWFEQQK